MLISILACLLGFHAITLERRTFYENRHIKNEASLVLNPFVSLFGLFLLRVVAENMVTDRHTDRHTDRQTDTQTKDCNPRCACAPRVNNKYIA